MTLFGLSLLQIFLLVLTVGLAVVGAEQIRTHVLNPMLTKARAWLSRTEAGVELEFEKLVGHAKSVAAGLPAGSSVSASSGDSSVTIDTAKPSLGLAKQVEVPAAIAPAYPLTALDPADAVKRYMAGGMHVPNGMPTLGELLWLFAQAPAAQVAWGQSVSSAFISILTTPFEAVTVGDVGAIRPEAAAYMNEIAVGYPIVGSTHWLKA